MSRAYDQKWGEKRYDNKKVLSIDSLGRKTFRNEISDAKKIRKKALSRKLARKIQQKKDNDSKYISEYYKNKTAEFQKEYDDYDFDTSDSWGVNLNAEKYKEKLGKNKFSPKIKGIRTDHSLGDKFKEDKKSIGKKRQTRKKELSLDEEEKRLKRRDLLYDRETSVYSDEKIKKEYKGKLKSKNDRFVSLKYDGKTSIYTGKNFKDEYKNKLKKKDSKLSEKLSKLETKKDRLLSKEHVLAPKKKNAIEYEREKKDNPFASKYIKGEKLRFAKNVGLRTISNLSKPPLTVGKYGIRYLGRKYREESKTKENEHIDKLEGIAVYGSRLAGVGVKKFHHKYISTQGRIARISDKSARLQGKIAENRFNLNDKPLTRRSSDKVETWRTRGNSFYARKLTAEEKKEIYRKNVKKKAVQNYKIAKAKQDAKHVQETSMLATNMIKRVKKRIAEEMARATAAKIIAMVLGLLASVLLFIVIAAALIIILMIIFSGNVYLTTDEDISESYLHFHNREVVIQQDIDETEKNFEGFDLYEYKIDDIGHDPNLIIAYLAAKNSDFKHTEVKDELDEIFEEMYSLKRETVEIPPSTPPPVAQKKLVTSLETKDLKEILEARLTEDEKLLFDSLVESDGGYRNLISPLGKDIEWKELVTSHYGMRKHPLDDEYKMHYGMDLALEEGTALVATTNAVVKSIENTTEGGITLTYGYKDEDNKDFQIIYKHLSTTLVDVGDEVKEGDIIAKSGNTGKSTGPHLHLEIKVDKKYVNPYFYFESSIKGLTGTLITPGNTGEATSIQTVNDGTRFTENPGISFTSDVQALFDEAEKHLGKAYVWGGSTSSGFDCSGFIYYVMKTSGYKNLPYRTNASGLYHNFSNKISESELKPGDLVFFHSTTGKTTSYITHVGIYAGDGYMIHCGDPCNYTQIRNPFFSNKIYGFGRLK